MAFDLNLPSFFTGEVNLAITLTFFTAVIVIYSVFVFYFYRFLARKNIIELNLNQYNQYANPAAVKFFAVIFYLIEYVILLPILTFFWFSVLSVLLLILAENLDVKTVLLISAALVSAVRITSYVTEDLAKDLAKMLPFTLLAIAITNVAFFDIAALVSRATEIPSLFSHIPYYLLFIVSVELIMRTFTFFESVFTGEPIDGDEEDGE